MIVALIIHMVRVFVCSAFKNPRELNWVIGVSLFLIMLFFGFTGYLLPWNQKAYWATTIGINMIGSMPVVGKYLIYLFMGEEEIGGLTLLRFYSLHVLWLPLFSGILIWLHFHMIRRQGIASHF
jgi:quinol-cytochrome oxidoreductase complex cytochrome b subunit